MSDIDTDGDGSLSILDVLSIFYLTELYLKALSGKACELAFSACRYISDVIYCEIWYTCAIVYNILGDAVV